MYYVLVLLLISIFISPSSNLKREIVPKVPNLNQFLQKIQEIESSGGKNTDHPVVEEGIQAGDQAIGRYGLMPNTIRELVNRRRMQGTSTGELQDLSRMPAQEMKKYIEQSPSLEDELAKQMATMVTRRQGGDEDRSAYSWTMGHNLTPDKISNEQLQESPYVQKYRKLKGILSE